MYSKMHQFSSSYANVEVADFYVHVTAEKTKPIHS